MVAGLAMTALAQTPAYPTQQGTYLQTADGYHHLELNQSSGMKTHGALKAMATYGVHGVDADWIYKGAHASTQITQHKPAFLLVSTADTSIDSVQLVRFDVKKDSREIRASHANAYGGVETGSKDKDSITLTVTRTSEGYLLITSKEDLQPGEYLLMDAVVPSGGYNGYTFGVQ
jgi:hypothetical protein